MFEKPVAQQVVVAVFPPGEDCKSLDAILGHSIWQLRFCHTFAETQAALHAGPVAVVLSEGRLSDGYSWKDVLQHLQDLPSPAPLIVADRLADEALWAEVLNLGGYDVLAKPFNAREVLHAVTTAWHFSVEQHDRPAEHRKPPGSAACETSPGQRARAALGAC